MRQFLDIVIAAFIITGALSARAAEITLIAPGGIRAPLERIVPEFERQTGHKVLMTITSGGGTKDRVTRGESFDVPIIQPPYETETHRFQSRLEFADRGQKVHLRLVIGREATV